MAVTSVISGTPQIGSTLNESGTATNGETLTAREWQQAGTSGGTFTAIAGATSATFTTTSAQASKFIRCYVTYKDGGPDVFATSNVIGPIGQGGGNKQKSTAIKKANPPVVELAPVPVYRKQRQVAMVDTSKWPAAMRPKR